jgi:DNA mismatch endonuclease (patch repair protein)
MTDKLTPERRSANMRQIRSRDTKPELTVRSFAHRLGFRFRLNRRDLPGCPDLVFPRLRSIVFVHGCFWHGHGCKRGGKGPRSNTGYWTPKILRTKQRDARSKRVLRSQGWRVLILWECQTDAASLEDKLTRFLTEAKAQK